MSQQTKGFQGNQGRQGVQGLQQIGTFGTQGSQGSQGFQARGFQGAAGISGAEAGRGFQGFQGFRGTFGSQGFQGVQGLHGGFLGIGLQGFVGIFGNQGVQGSFGPVIGFMSSGADSVPANQIQGTFIGQGCVSPISGFCTQVMPKLTRVTKLVASYVSGSVANTSTATVFTLAQLVAPTYPTVVPVASVPVGPSAAPFTGNTATLILPGVNIFNQGDLFTCLITGNNQPIFAEFTVEFL